MDVQVAKILAAGIAAVGVLGSGVGLGILFGNVVTALGRNPSAAPLIKKDVILYFALIESIAIYALGMAFFVVYGIK
ncbi:MAG: F0F1 ATP synthase subunit C [Alphaproteobacteria bacterium]|nr:F0F1 ATP synthase subunit C [Alphaproteobacteria bacterium]MDE2335694.1 F0F1 ATP synthase subunit C [Alphaproteobacteria bacterium]